MEIFMMGIEKNDEEIRIMKGYARCCVCFNGQYYEVDIESAECHFNAVQNEMEMRKNHGDFSFLCSHELLVSECSNAAILSALKGAAQEGILPYFSQLPLMNWDKAEGVDDFSRANVTFPDGRMMNKHLLRYQERLFSFVIEKHDHPVSDFILRNDYDDEAELRGIIDMLAESGIFAEFEPHYAIAMTELRLLWKDQKDISVGV